MAYLHTCKLVLCLPGNSILYPWLKSTFHMPGWMRREIYIIHMLERKQNLTKVFEIPFLNWFDVSLFSFYNFIFIFQIWLEVNLMYIDVMNLLDIEMNNVIILSWRQTYISFEGREFSQSSQPLLGLMKQQLSNCWLKLEVSCSLEQRMQVGCITLVTKWP